MGPISRFADLTVAHLISNGSSATPALLATRGGILLLACAGCDRDISYGSSVTFQSLHPPCARRQDRSLANADPFLANEHGSYLRPKICIAWILRGRAAAACVSVAPSSCYLAAAAFMSNRSLLGHGRSPEDACVCPNRSSFGMGW